MIEDGIGAKRRSSGFDTGIIWNATGIIGLPNLKTAETDSAVFANVAAALLGSFPGVDVRHFEILATATGASRNPVFVDGLARH